MRVVITDHPFVQAAREHEMAEKHGADFVELVPGDARPLAELVDGADVLLVNLRDIGDAELAHLNTGAVVIRYGIGFDNVDVDAAARRGIAVTNAPGYGTDTVADHAVALLLSCARRLSQFDRAIRDDGGTTAPAFGPIPSLNRCTLGLAGLGRIGTAVAARAQALGMTVIAHDPAVGDEAMGELGIGRTSLDELFRSADFVSLHAPLTPETRHLVDARRLATMKPGAVLVNTSRGGLVDTAALAVALRDGHLAAAGLDVFEQEPLATDSPLRQLSNVVLTPHAASFSDEALDRLQRMAVDELELALTGHPPRNRVN